MLRIILCGIVITFLSGSIAPAADPETGIQIGMVQGIFRDVQPAMVRALSRPLRDLIQKQTGFVGDVEIVPDAFALAEKMSAKKCQLGVFHGFEFAWIRSQHSEIVPLAVTVPPGRKLQACVIVPRDAKTTCLADLKDESILVPHGSKAHCHLYLERQRLNLSPKIAIPKFKPAVTAEEALDAIVTGTASAALVDSAALNGYEHLQPGASKHLKVLCESEPFPQTVVAYNKNALDAKTVESIRLLLTQAHRNPAGRPLMMLWNLKGFEDVPSNYEAHLDSIMKSYPPPTLTQQAGTAGR